MKCNFFLMDGDPPPHDSYINGKSKTTKYCEKQQSPEFHIWVHAQPRDLHRGPRKPHNKQKARAQKQTGSVNHILR